MVDTCAGQPLLPIGLQQHLAQLFASALAVHRGTVVDSSSELESCCAAAIVDELGRLAATPGPPPPQLPAPLVLRPATDEQDAAFISSQLVAAGLAVGGDEPHGLKALCSPGGAFAEKQRAAALRKVEKVSNGAAGARVGPHDWPACRSANRRAGPRRPI